MEGSDEKAKSWMRSIDRKRKWRGGWGDAALLILDMQDFFLAPKSHAYMPSGRTALSKILELVKKTNFTVFLTRHVNTMDEENLMNAWWRDVINGPMSHISSQLNEVKGEIINKSHYSAFHDTELEDLLKKKGIDTVIISGVMTDLCCETTARDAFMRGFKVVFLADCTATETEERHLCTLKSISRAFGEVVTSKELMSRS